jgi:ribosomal protein S5
MTFLQARNDVGVAMLAQLHHDPAAAHLVGDGAGGAGAGEGVEDEVAGLVAMRKSTPPSCRQLPKLPAKS